MREQGLLEFFFYHNSGLSLLEFGYPKGGLEGIDAEEENNDPSERPPGNLAWRNPVHRVNKHRAPAPQRFPFVQCRGLSIFLCNLDSKYCDLLMNAFQKRKKIRKTFCQKHSTKQLQTVQLGGKRKTCEGKKTIL